MKLKPNRPFKIGDVIEFNKGHIKPNTNNKVTIIGINRTEKFSGSQDFIRHYKFHPKTLVLCGNKFEPMNYLAETSALEEQSIKVGTSSKIKVKLLKVLYGEK